jgi:hypothetical protein
LASDAGGKEQRTAAEIITAKKVLVLQDRLMNSSW